MNDADVQEAGVCDDVCLGDGCRLHGQIRRHGDDRQAHDGHHPDRHRSGHGTGHHPRGRGQGRRPVDTLKGTGPFTVFAPTNEAFAKLPAGTVDSLLKPENKDKLVKILTYHVVSGDNDSKAVMGMTSAKSVEGDTINIKTADGKVMLGNDKAMATVIKPDIKCTNGTIHWIDTVLMPTN